MTDAGARNLTAVQGRVDEWISQFEEGYWPPLANLARLMEEVGELARLVNHRFGTKPKKPDESEQEMAEELADVLFVILCMANEQGIDLDEAFDAVMETNKVNFETGLANITRESGQTLDKVMTVSQRCAPDLVFEVGGHTDATGAREANIALSEARARAVRDYMVSAGFSPSRLTVIGYGPDEAVQSNDTEDGRAKNRRIGFKVRERSE